MRPRARRSSSRLQGFLDHQGFVVLDGGLSTALEAEGHALDSALWSAKLLLDAPEAIRSVHASFLSAGADVISTASYQATLPGFAQLGIDGAEGARLLRRSVDLAVEARTSFWTQAGEREGRLEPLVAASVGPYGAYLADGSEYDGRYAASVGKRALADFHRPRLEILAETGADLLALETIPSLAEVEVLVALLADLRHPGAWISFTCRDGGHLRDGSALEDAVRACSGDAGLVALGINCTAPGHVAGLVRRMRAVTDLPILAYPNSGETYDARSGSWIGEAPGRAWLDLVPVWIDAGARMVGGCCRVGPEMIRGVRRAAWDAVARPDRTGRSGGN